MNNEKIDALSEQQIEALNQQLADIGDDEVFRERWLEAYSNRLWATVNKGRAERQRMEADLEELRGKVERAQQQQELNYGHWQEIKHQNGKLKKEIWRLGGQIDKDGNVIRQETTE